MAEPHDLIHLNPHVLNFQFPELYLHFPFHSQPERIIWNSFGHILPLRHPFLNVEVIGSPWQQEQGVEGYA
jgi:hypothetical protein